MAVPANIHAIAGLELKFFILNNCITHWDFRLTGPSWANTTGFISNYYEGQVGPTRQDSYRTIINPSAEIKQLLEGVQYIYFAAIIAVLIRSVEILNGLQIS
jgi:hypothetical protein